MYNNIIVIHNQKPKIDIYVAIAAVLVVSIYNKNKFDAGCMDLEGTILCEMIAYICLVSLH